jgi:hypothetical protein
MNMASQFARNTEVPVERSRAEIEGLLIKYGASEFHSGWMVNAAQVGFRLKDLYIRFVLPIPAKGDPKYKSRVVRVGGRQKVKHFTEGQAERLREQEIKSRWRALALVVKAKLEAVECGISTLENEFLAFIVLPGVDFTIGDWMTENAMEAIRGGTVPLQLGPRAVTNNEA